jgi:hypothetical protein
VQVLEEKLLQFGVTSRRVLGLCLGISWISSALLLTSEGVEEDLLPCFWSIYIEEVFARLSSPQGFPRIICVSIVSVIVSLLVILFMQLMC